MCSECIATSDYWVRETRHVWECAFWRSKVECSHNWLFWNVNRKLLLNIYLPSLNNFVVNRMKHSLHVSAKHSWNSLWLVWYEHFNGKPAEGGTDPTRFHQPHSIYIHICMILFSLSLSLGRRKFKQTTVLLWHNMHVFYSIVWKIKNFYAGIWKYASQCWHTYDAQTPEQTYKPPYT